MKNRPLEFCSPRQASFRLQDDVNTRGALVVKSLCPKNLSRITAMFSYNIFQIFQIFSIFFKIYVHGLSQNWCSLSLDGLVMLSIRIPTNRMYSVVYYLSNKPTGTCARQIDLELGWFCEKSMGPQSGPTPSMPGSTREPRWFRSNGRLR